jgi:hypothetical protein
MLDPYYRTMDGFAMLISKDWMGFGHMFQKRLGHYSTQDMSNRSEVFLQWLDMVHNVWHQMSGQFEFNDDYILYLAKNLCTCKFGTFFFNNE